MTKLADLVNIVENNTECVVLEVKENSFKDLVCLGCFNGDEKMIRLTKGKNHTCTVWTNNDKHYSWYWGESGHTLVSDALFQKGRLIEDCIVKDLDINIRKDIESTLHKTLADRNKQVTLQLCWWDYRPSSIQVHRGHELYDSYNSKDRIIQEMANKSYKLANESQIETAVTGAKVQYLTFQLA